VRATSNTQHDWAPGMQLPDLEMVGDSIWSVSMNMPDRHIFYSLCYLVVDADGRVHVIDPGWGSDENWARLLNAFSRIGKSLSDVSSIICTHFHPDHLGMAERLRDSSESPIMIHEIEAAALHEMQMASTLTVVSPSVLEGWGVPGDSGEQLLALAAAPSGMPEAVVDRGLTDGMRLDVPGWHLQVLHTPGHTSGHVCFIEPVRKLIFTGDHVLPTIFAGIGLGGPTLSNPLADYLNGLDAVRRYDDYEVLPGHGYRFRGLSERCDQTEAHHLRRAREVAQVLEENAAATVWQVAERVSWSAGWSNLRGFYQLSALRQTAMHVEFVRSDVGLDRLTRSAA
jgi:glyoxylase-like metal-dependent hydrolase (beta-lactamase superfamily II)